MDENMLRPVRPIADTNSQMSVNTRANTNAGTGTNAGVNAAVNENAGTGAVSGANTGCDFKSGPLPACAPLAVSFVPVQQEAKPQYKNAEALTRGTLFPGLDLPFLNIPNKTNPYAGTPLGELMALGFMIGELNLYLDTHPDDQEAFEALKAAIKLNNEGQEKYAKMYGPISIGDLANFNSYTWLHDPWPWEFTERTGMD